MNKMLRLLALVLTVGLVAAACGSDDVESSPAVSGEAAEEATAADTPATVVDIAASSDDFSTLVAAVTEAGLVETLSGEGPFTVFAPTDAAFATALDDLGITADELLADTDTLTSILTYHVVPGEVLAADVVGLDGQSAATVNGAEIDISLDGDNVMIDGATVTTVDLLAGNGVVHVIDGVLLP